MAYFKILCHCIYLKHGDDLVLLFVYYFNAEHSEQLKFTVDYVYN